MFTTHFTFTTCAMAQQSLVVSVLRKSKGKLNKKIFQIYLACFEIELVLLFFKQTCFIFKLNQINFWFTINIYFSTTFGNNG